MSKTLITTFAVGLFAVVAAGSADAQTVPAADPHAGHRMPVTVPQTAPAADPHAGHAMPASAPQAAPATNPHAGHDMSGMTPAAPTGPTAPAGAMDHSTMQGMDHSNMPGMTPAAPTAQAGAMDHSTMQGMDHSNMPGMAAMTSGTALTVSSPADGSMLQGSPSEISMTLPHAMTLQSVSLSNAVGQRIPLSATLPGDPTETFSSPVPILPAGNYIVAWTAGTGDHTMNGTFGFMVH